MASRRSLYCDCCGDSDFVGEADGFYFCTQCGSQSQDLIQTATACEDVKAGGGGLYNTHFTRPRHLRDDEPRDFGERVCYDPEKLADGIRLRYVKGLQLMLQSQCEVLVEKFGASPFIVAIVGQIWLRFVVTTRVLADDWPDEMIEESDMAAEAAGLVRVGEEERPNKLKSISSKDKSEPHNAYGKRAIHILLRALRRAVPLYSTLAISFLVCHIAREPILPTDIYKWACEGKLPYLTAFVDMDTRLGNHSNDCPFNSTTLFRPKQIIRAEQLEAAAASIAQTIGLRLPSVNFYAIANRYLKELCLPVNKICPHACHIYEWSLPADLWLSSSELGFPIRACVMSILIVAMRLLYNVQGQGTWEMSHSQVRNFPSNDRKAHLSPVLENSSSTPRDENLDDDTKKHYCATGSKPSKKLLQIQSSDYNSQELLSILEAAYDKINTAHDYSKDLFTYLKHCKDVVYAGIGKSNDEETIIERLWDLYKKQESDSTQEAKRQKIGESIDDSLDPNEQKDGNTGMATPMEEDIAEANYKKETVVANAAVEKIKLEMEENGFEYLAPRAHQKIGYAHFKRQRVNGALVYVAHADYYILLRACAKLIEVSAQNMHRCVLSLERRIEWIDRQIDKLICPQDDGV